MLVVDYLYGELGTIRLVGGVWLLVAVWGIWAPSVEFRMGQFLVADLTGWKKAWLLVPAAAGLALLYYAAELASTE